MKQSEFWCNSILNIVLVMTKETRWFLQQWSEALTSNSSSICNSRPELFLRAAEQQQYDDDDVQGMNNKQFEGMYAVIIP